MMRWGFTGTRSELTEPQVAALRARLSAIAATGPRAELHHGACLGADAVAHELAREVGLEVVVHPPDEDRYLYRVAMLAERVWPERPYLARNRDIVECTDALIAVPEGPERLRSGTWSTVRHARRHSRPITIIWPDGSIDAEQQAA